MNRRHFLSVTGCSVAATAVLTKNALASVAATAGGNQRQPNIIFINTDDWGIGKVNAYKMDPKGSQKIIRTPNIDKLAADGVRFTSHTDTEVILALYEREGLQMFPRLRGMYAFAIWDEKTQRLVLARDPYGIKPLFYTLDEHHLRFASQVKGLEAGGRIDGTIDPAGLVGFLLWGSVPEPYTLRRHVRSLPAGHYLVVEDAPHHQPHD